MKKINFEKSIRRLEDYKQKQNDKIMKENGFFVLNIKMSKDKTIPKIDLLIACIDEYSKKIQEDITHFPKNESFYNEHAKLLNELLEDIDNKFQKNSLTNNDFVLPRSAIQYHKTIDDTYYCLGRGTSIGANVGGSILGLVTGTIGLLAGGGVSAGGLIFPATAVAGAIILGIPGAIIGAIIGALIGLIAGFIYSKCAKEPMSESYREKNASVCIAIKECYTQLSYKQTFFSRSLDAKEESPEESYNAVNSYSGTL